MSLDQPFLVVPPLELPEGRVDARAMVVRLNSKKFLTRGRIKGSDSTGRLREAFSFEFSTKRRILYVETSAISARSEYYVVLLALPRNDFLPGMPGEAKADVTRQASEDDLNRRFKSSSEVPICVTDRALRVSTWIAP
jgi:hypothetical protein